MTQTSSNKRKAMKEIKAIVKPSPLEVVVHALRQIIDLPAHDYFLANALCAEHGTFE